MIKYILTILFLILIITFGGAIYSHISSKVEEPANIPINEVVEIEHPTDVPIQYIGKMKLKDFSIRLLILKHCPDDIANVDATEALQAVNLAKTEGLNIEDIGNYHVDPNGKINTMSCQSIPLTGLKQFVSDQMKVDAEPGDTLIVYTLGHGSKDGSLMSLGQRRYVMEMLAEAAEENEQQTLWWQLSCKAAAFLPSIATLTERQQEFFSMIASSEANELSYFRTQADQMQKMFVALAKNNQEINPNQDRVISMKELKDFLNKYVEAGRGNLAWAKNANKIIFGYPNLANTIPIVEANGTQAEYPDGYIPSPNKKGD